MKIIFILLFFVSLNLSSQTFELYLGDSTFNRGLNSIELPDSTFIVSGSYVDSDSIQKSYLVRVSSSGEIIWEKKYSTPYGIVLLDNDSGFNICYNIGDSISITKLNNHGTVQWTNYISTHLYRENATSFAKYPNGNFLIVGYAKTDIGPTNLFWMLADSLGNKKWVKFILYSRATQVKINSEGYAVIVGKEYDYMFPPLILLLKIDPNGDLVWDKTYEIHYATAHDGTCVDFTNDGGYILCGEIFEDLWVYTTYIMKVNQNGWSLWCNPYFTNNTSFRGSIASTPDNCYVYTGKMNNDALLLKIDDSGDTLWTKCYGGNNQEEGKSIIIAKENYYVVTGTTDSYGHGSADIYFLKTYNNGLITDYTSHYITHNSCTVFPNPVWGSKIYLKGEFREYNRLILKLISLDGQLIQSSKVNNNQVDLQKDIPSGLYVYVLESEKGLVDSGKIIFNK